MASTAKKEVTKKNAVKVKKDHEVEGTEKRAVKIENVVEPKTGVSFHCKLDDGKQLYSFGTRANSLGFKIYGFGIYVEKARLEEVLKKLRNAAPEEPTKEMLIKSVIDSDVEMMVRLVIVTSGLTMTTVREDFSKGLGASIGKIIRGRKDELVRRRKDELVKKVMGAATDAIELTPGSVIEITRLPGFYLQAKVKDAIGSKVEAGALLCRACFYMYLGDDPIDKESKEIFGNSMISLFRKRE